MALVWVIALSLGFYGVKGGIFTVITGGGYQVRGPGASFIGGNNEIGLALAMTVPLLFFLSRHATASISAWLLAAAVLTCVCGARHPVARRPAGHGRDGRVPLAEVAQQDRDRHPDRVVRRRDRCRCMPEEWFERMSTIKTYEQDGSALGRINAWWMAFNLASHRPTGGGFETFQAPSFALYAPNPTGSRFPQHLLPGAGTSWIHRPGIVPLAAVLHLAYGFVRSSGPRSATRRDLAERPDGDAQVA